MIWNGHTIVIHEGQLITGRDKLSEITGIPHTTIDRILEYLENEGQIGQQKTTKYRLITILNWKDYQERASNGHQTGTNKNEKKDKNIPASSETSLVLDEETEDTEETQYVLDEDSEGYRVEPWGRKKAEPREPNKNEEFLKNIERVYSKRFLNRPKQYKALNTMRANGVTAVDIEECIDKMLTKEFYKENGWDMVNVMSELSKK